MSFWTERDPQWYTPAVGDYESHGTARGLATELEAPRREPELRTKQELEHRARVLGIRGRSRMRKDELIEAIRRAEG